ncbi:MAG: pyridoxal phosphate-dependent aminotransferase [Bacteroidaceae bacterium]|nr:pyridoxal phosphate-dependent aminotransferase [Bacteroidaceae bacterium]
MNISERINRLSTSATLAMAQKSAELKAAGVNVISLAVGEPDFDTPDHICRAAEKAINDGYTHYSPVAGYPELRNAISKKLLNENQLQYDPAEIVVSNGAKQSVCNALLAMVDDGDEVIIPAPYWVSYPDMVLLAGGKPVIVETGLEQNFKITPAQLKQAITAKTKALILCSPSNPTGAVYSAAELAALADVVKQHEDIAVISDEIYEHINYVGRHASIAAVPGMKPRTVIIGGVSKAYAMTGWRIGYLAAPAHFAKAVSKLQGQYTSGPGSMNQMAAVAAYSDSQECVEQMRQAFEKRKNLIMDLVRNIPGLEVNDPEGAFYVFPKCSSYYGKQADGRTIEGSADLALYLLETAHVALVGGHAFGAPDYLRMSYATSEDDIRTAMGRIKEALARLS